MKYRQIIGWLVLLIGTLSGIWLLLAALMNAWLTATPSAELHLLDYRRNFWLFLVGGISILILSFFGFLVLRRK